MNFQNALDRNLSAPRLNHIKWNHARGLKNQMEETVNMLITIEGASAWNPIGLLHNPSLCEKNWIMIIKS